MKSGFKVFKPGEAWNKVKKRNGKLTGMLDDTLARNIFIFTDKMAHSSANTRDSKTNPLMTTKLKIPSVRNKKVV